jgi:hypothetical protein
MKHRDLLSRPEWRDLHESLPALAGFLASDPASHGLRSLLGAAGGLLERLQLSLDRGWPSVWYNLGFTAELLFALGEVNPIPAPLLGAFHSLLGDSDRALELIDVAEAAGVPHESCSADKLSVGAMLRGLYPSPACCVAINTPCDTQVLTAGLMEEISGAPLFVVDVPYYVDERTVRHVARQLRDLIPFLEQTTGRRLDPERLRRACALANQTSEAIWEWLEWRKAVPVIQASKLCAFTFIIQILFSGEELGLQIARALAREARERTERGDRLFDERVRAVWYQDPVWSDMQIYDWFERDLGLTVPIDVFGYFAHEALVDLSSLETMLEGLARKLVNCHPMSRQFRSDMGVYIQNFMHLHEAWRADCGIFAGHVACKHAWGGIGLFREACRRAGIPLLVFEFDMFDPRVTPYDALFFEVERFVNEVVLPRKLRGGLGPGAGR